MSAHDHHVGTTADTNFVGLTTDTPSANGSLFEHFLETTTVVNSNPNTPRAVDHSGHDSSSGTQLHSGMKMYFHTDYSEDNVLFQFWTITSVPGMVGSCIGIFILAMLYEGLKVLRDFLCERADGEDFRRRYEPAENFAARLPESATPSEEATVSASPSANGHLIHSSSTEFRRAFGAYHLVQTVLHMVQVTLSYFLMLIAMTFNVWLFLSIVLGAGAGHLLFAWRRRLVRDTVVTDTTCH